MHIRARERIIRLLLLVLAHPYIYTKRQLAEYFDVHKDTIKSDILIIKNAGINLTYEFGHYRYAIVPDPDFKELRHLQILTEDEKGYYYWATPAESQPIA